MKLTLTFLRTTILSSFTSYSPAASIVVIANSISSRASAVERNAFANSLSLSAKNPITATSRGSAKAFTSPAFSKTVAGGPVFLLSHVMISSPVRPPKRKGNKLE